ncbi:LptF/LptG family permease [Siccirubricoccus phaeus]|uniref:LptF/LptG family permease n=1 Tax=Siccirubricoccus phaeus TaxID=2595053 RepID=UPI0011F2FC82|nr:LptF/LptG family permease [Siccirubricoccus phaeus]
MSGSLAFSRDRGRPVGSTLVTCYMLRLLAKPLAGTLLLVLPALLLERLLRLFDLLAGAGSPAASIVQLLLYLVPHYLGLAMPAALFIAVYAVVAQLSRDQELDALQATGLSLAQLSRPFLAVGLLCAVLGIGLYGYVQPLSRYAYRAAFHALTHAGWNATLVPGEFVPVSRHSTVTVDRRNPAGGLLYGIVVHERRGDGTEVLTTAAKGRLLLDRAQSELLVELEHGRQLILAPDGRVTTLDFTASSQSRPFVQRLPVFRLRGADERELTLDELWAAQHSPDPPVAPARLAGELHGRLVRAASLLVLPLLAMPMGLAAKRTRRFLGILLAAVILVVYQQALQLLEALGDVGRIDPRPALWVTLLLFAGFAATVFRHGNRHPEEGAFDGLLAALDHGTSAATEWLSHRLRRSA